MKAKGPELSTPKPKTSRLAIVSVSVAVLGWIFFLPFNWVNIGYDGAGDSLLRYSGLCATLSWFVSLALGIVALRKIKRRYPYIKGKKMAQAGTWISAASLTIFLVLPYLGIAAIERHYRLRDCDPAQLVATVKKNFEFEFPKKIDSLKAAEVHERIYRFVMRFSTDQNGWKQLQRSILRTAPSELAGAFGFEDIQSGYDPRGEFKFFSLYTHSIPKWYRRKIKKGEMYLGYIESKNRRMQIRTLCADTADLEQIIVYMEGWGDYYAGYDLRYINPENPTVVPDNPKAVRWLLDRFSENMKVKFPDDTTLINATQQRSLSGHAYLKIKIGRTSLKAFIESSPFSDKPLCDDRRFCGNVPELPWWDTEKPKIFKSGETQLSKIYWLRILIDLDVPNAAVIYLEWLEI